MASALKRRRSETQTPLAQKRIMEFRDEFARWCLENQYITPSSITSSRLVEDRDSLYCVIQGYSVLSYNLASEFLDLIRNYADEINEKDVGFRIEEPIHWSLEREDDHVQGTKRNIVEVFYSADDGKIHVFYNVYSKNAVKLEDVVSYRHEHTVFDSSEIDGVRVFVKGDTVERYYSANPPRAYVYGVGGAEAILPLSVDENVLASIIEESHRLAAETAERSLRELLVTK